MTETYIVLGQQAGTELHVVFEVERPHSLEPGTECIEVGRLVKLLHTPDTAELLLRVLRDG